MYHATMPTDALRTFRDVLKESEIYGLQRLKKHQQSMGEKVRTLLQKKHGCEGPFSFSSIYGLRLRGFGSEEAWVQRVFEHFFFLGFTVYGLAGVRFRVYGS